MLNMIHDRRLWISVVAVIGVIVISAEAVAVEAATANVPMDIEPITPIPPPMAADPGKIALGKRLFDDPHLSGDGTRSCSSCHDLSTNGADGRVKDTAPNGEALDFNTPSVFDAALNFRLGWEGNFKTLEEQAKASLESPRMMGSNIPKALEALQNDPVLRQQFETTYGHAPDEGSLLDAIAVFERSLTTPGSRFDLWLAGDAGALSAKEKQGYQLFKADGCASCHQGANVGGNLFEHSGIFHPLSAGQSPLLRVPSLRNVAVTAPYFHDGSAATLNDAVRRMASAQLGEQPSSLQIQAIVAFLYTLTGKYQGKTLTAPSP